MKFVDHIPRLHPQPGNEATSFIGPILRPQYVHVHVYTHNPDIQYMSYIICMQKLEVTYSEAISDESSDIL